MNRKIIANDLLNWPEINKVESDRVIALIEDALKPFSQLIRRKKTPPKRIRLKIKKKESQLKDLSMNETDESNLKESTTPDQEKQSNEKEIVTKCLKNLIKIGINAITKELENAPHNVKFVLVCESNRPLSIMTRHLQIMCFNSNVPAGCIDGLSSRLAKFFNIKTISAFAICDEMSLIKSDATTSDEIYLLKAKDIAKQLAEKVSKCIPCLKYPFKSSSENISEEINQIQIDTETIQEIVPKILTETKEPKNPPFESDTEDMETFGSDFISINSSSRKEISFDSAHFILFNDEYSKAKEQPEMKNEEIIFRSFNQFSIIQKSSDKKKKDLKKSKKIKLKTFAKK